MQEGSSRVAPSIGPAIRRLIRVSAQTFAVHGHLLAHLARFPWRNASSNELTACYDIRCRLPRSVVSLLRAFFFTDCYTDRFSFSAIDSFGRVDNHQAINDISVCAIPSFGALPSSTNSYHASSSLLMACHITLGFSILLCKNSPHWIIQRAC